MSDNIIKSIQRAAVDCALSEWRRVVRDQYKDPKTGELYAYDQRIVRYHTDSGAAWPVRDGYQENKDYWCGVFAAFCFASVGDYILQGQCVDLRLKPDIAKYVFPSTTRLDSAAKWAQAGVEQARQMRVDQIRKGDVVVFSTGRTDRDEGDHVTLALGPIIGDEIDVVEGNGWGLLGDGTRGEGVVTNTRDVANIARVWRVRMQHFTGSYL